MNCFICGGKLRRKRYTHVQKVGDQSVTNATAMMPTCDACGEVFISARDLAIYEARAASLVLHRGKVDGKVLRFARKALGLTQAKLAEQLGHDSTWISRCETGAAEASRADQLAIAALLSEEWMRLYRGEEVMQQAPTSDSLEVKGLPRCKKCG